LFVGGEVSGVDLRIDVGPIEADLDLKVVGDMDAMSDDGGCLLTRFELKIFRRVKK
jgi:hypothetical protein